jgi:hypothetical protein
MADTERKFDELLNNALAEYSNVEPREGLEDRILANLATPQPEKRPWLQWWPVWGLAVAAAILLIVVISMPKHGEQIEGVKKTPTAVPQGRQKAGLQQMATTMAPPHVLHGRRTHVTATQPSKKPPLAVLKQPVFPAPSALTDQEKMLFAYLRKTDVMEIAANAKPDDPPFPERQLNQVLPVQKNADSNTNAK